MFCGFYEDKEFNIYIHGHTYTFSHIYMVSDFIWFEIFSCSSIEVLITC